MNQHDKDRIDQLSDDLQAFKEQYILDMHGPTAVEPSTTGLLPEIRELKRLWMTYPSLLWLLYHKPVQIFSVFLLLSAMYVPEARLWLWHNFLGILGLF